MIQNEAALRQILEDVEFHEGGVLDGVMLHTGPLGPGFGLFAARTSLDHLTQSDIVRTGPVIPVARDATRGEVIAAAYKAAADLLQQEAAYGFLYKGQPIYALARHPDSLHKLSSAIGTDKVRN